MIFVTVGSQTPFDRLIEAIDRWSATASESVIAQIGAGSYIPQHMQWTRELRPADFRRHVFESQLVIAHAGMGTILTALELGRPILVMPRKAALGETRNDHQFATCDRFGEAGFMTVAADESQLVRQLNDLPPLNASEPICSHASLRLLSTVREFITGQTQPQPSDVERDIAAVLPPVIEPEEWRDAKAA